MTTRTTQVQVHIPYLFDLPGIAEKQPPGNYRIDYVEEVIETASRLAWRRIEAFIYLPELGTGGLQHQMVPIGLRDLDAVLERKLRKT